MESPLRRMKVYAHLLYGVRMGAEYSAEWFCTVKNGWSRARPVLRIRVLLIVRRGVEIYLNPGPSGTLLTLSFAKILRGNGGSASFPSHKAFLKRPRRAVWAL